MTIVLVPNHSVPPAKGARETADVVLARLADLDPDRLPSRPVGEARPAAPASGGPGPWRRALRYWASRVTVAAVTRAYLRLRVDGRDQLPKGPAIYCFNHLNWTDPFVLLATLPMRPRLFFFGPKEEDMQVGGRNRLMLWTGTAVPYKPGKNDLLDATRRVTAVLESGGVLAIAGEGRIHLRESDLLPLNEGAAFFAIRTGVPLVPIAINGTSWLRFGRQVRVTIGGPIATSGRPTRPAITAYTGRTWAALHDLVADAPEMPRPGPVGRWLTELFNDWPEGERPTDTGRGDGDPSLRA